MVSVAVLTPIVLFVDAVGDALVLLLTFVVLWVGAFTLAVLFVPRVSVLISPPPLLQDAESGQREDWSGFSFLSMASFTSPDALTQYAAALEAQVAGRQGAVHNDEGRGQGMARRPHAVCLAQEERGQHHHG